MNNEAARIPSRYRPESKGVLHEYLNIPLFLSAVDKQRRERGEREHRRVKKSDAVLFSPGNSGRTWLRVMLTRLIELHYELNDLPEINFDNLHKIDGRVLKLAVTHNRWLPYYKFPRQGSECRAYYASRVVFLVRNPLDTCISQYYQWKHRSSDKNVHLKGWPDQSSDLSLIEFLDDERTGTLRLCQELNIWMQELPKFKQAHLVRYEDLREQTETGIKDIARFLSIDAAPQMIREAVEFARFDKMQERESERSHTSEERHRNRVAVENNNGMKARKGLIAGYTKTLGAEDCPRYEKMVSDNLDSRFGYGRLPDIGELEYAAG